MEKSLEKGYYIEVVKDKGGQDVGQSVEPDFIARFVCLMIGRDVLDKIQFESDFQLVSCLGLHGTGHVHKGV